MKSPETISEYIQNESADVQKVLKKMRSIIKKAAPKAKEKLAWGMPTFHQEGNLVHFAAFKNHLSLFPGAEALSHFKKALTAYQTSKGTLQFQYGTSIPSALVTKIVKYNLKLNLAHAKIKQSKKKTAKKKTQSR